MNYDWKRIFSFEIVRARDLSNSNREERGPFRRFSSVTRRAGAERGQIGVLSDSRFVGCVVVNQHEKLLAAVNTL